MTLAHVTTHADQAVARLLEQYRSKPRLAGLADNLAVGIQGLEDATWAMAQGRPLDVAQGEALDAYGSLAGFPRAGLDDESYRTVLRGVIAENYSDGTRNTAVQILDRLFRPQGIFAHNRMAGGDVGYGLWSPAVSPTLYRMMKGVFERSLAAGVRLDFLETFDAPAFAMAGPQPWVAGFNGLSAASANLLSSNLARGGDTDGNVSEWTICTAGEAFGTTSGGGDSLLSMLSLSASGDFHDAPWEGDKCVLVDSGISGDGSGHFGAKFTASGLSPLTSYAFSFYGGGYYAGAGVFVEIYGPSGAIMTSSTTVLSPSSFTRKQAVFTTPAGCTVVELRVLSSGGNNFQSDWKMDGLMLNQGTSADPWENPSPSVETGNGGGFGSLI